MLVSAFICTILAVKSFAFITDIHYPVNAGEPEVAVEQAVKKNRATTVILGGDVFKSEKTVERAVARLDQAFEAFHNRFGKGFLWVQGNHDANSTAIKSRSLSESEALIPDTTIYNHTVAKLSAAIVADKALSEEIASMPLSPEDKIAATAWAGMHYSYDDKKSKIRFIVLETGDMGYTIRHTFRKKEALAKQEAFIRERLRTIPKGYDAVITGHQIGNSYDGPSSDSYAAVFAPALEFKQEGRGRIILISGDVHVDNSFSVGVRDGKVVWDYCPSGCTVPEDRVLLIWTSCDALLSQQKLVNGPKVRISGSTAYENRAKGTSEEHCFDIVSFIPDGIKCKRIGAGNDRFFKYNIK